MCIAVWPYRKGMVNNALTPPARARARSPPLHSTGLLNNLVHMGVQESDLRKAGVDAGILCKFFQAATRNRKMSRLQSLHLAPTGEAEDEAPLASSGAEAPKSPERQAKQPNSAKVAPIEGAVAAKSSSATSTTALAPVVAAGSTQGRLGEVAPSEEP